LGCPLWPSSRRVTNAAGVATDWGIMAHSNRVQFDRQLLDVYLIGLQTEVEEKLRELKRFRENMNVLAVSPTPQGRQLQRAAISQLREQITRMLGTNRVVRETLLELDVTANALARSLDDESL
jgi:hypothetical protein